MFVRLYIVPIYTSSYFTMDYSLSDSYTPTGGDISESIDNFAKQWVAGHYLLSFTLIVVLVLVLIVFIFWTGKEKFNPTQTLRDQDSDQFGLGKKETLDSGRGASAFAQQTQGTTGSLVIDPNATAAQPGSLAWQVLHNSDFNCKDRQPATDDAWLWMGGIARENLSNNKPKTDNEFSKVLAGH